MKIFIDSANYSDIEEAASLNLIDGVTTNPSLLAKQKDSFENIIKTICNIINGPISVEVAATNYENILTEGQKILDLHDNIVLKLPITWAGLKACRYFSQQGRKVNMTLCFSANQAMLAAKAGACYVSPFIGRLEDISHDGCQLIRDIRIIYDNYAEFTTQILAASIRNPQHVYMSALAGSEVVTLSLPLIKQLVTHPLTDQGLDIFIADWEKSGLKI